MLGAELEKYNCQVFHDTADADLTITIKAVESAESIDTVLIGESISCRNQERIPNFVYRTSKKKLGTYICKHILFFSFMTSFLGSNTTSCIYGSEKAALIKDNGFGKLC